MMIQFAGRLTSLLDTAATVLYPNLIYLIVGCLFFLFGVSRRKSS